MVCTPRCITLGHKTPIYAPKWGVDGWFATQGESVPTAKDASMHHKGELMDGVQFKV